MLATSLVLLALLRPLLDALALLLDEALLALHRVRDVLAGARRGGADVGRGRRHRSRPVALVGGGTVFEGRQDEKAAEFTGVVDPRHRPFLSLRAELGVGEEVSIDAVVAGGQELRAESADPVRDQQRGAARP